MHDGAVADGHALAYIAAHSAGAAYVDDNPVLHRGSVPYLDGLAAVSAYYGAGAYKAVGRYFYLADYGGGLADEGRGVYLRGEFTVSVYHVSSPLPWVI